VVPFSNPYDLLPTKPTLVKSSSGALTQTLRSTSSQTYPSPESINEPLSKPYDLPPPKPTRVQSLKMSHYPNPTLFQVPTLPCQEYKMNTYQTLPYSSSQTYPIQKFMMKTLPPPLSTLVKIESIVVPYPIISRLQNLLLQMVQIMIS